MSCQEDTNIKQVTFHSESQFQTISPKPQFEFQRTQCYVFFGNSSAEINNSEKFLVKNVC